MEGFVEKKKIVKLKESIEVLPKEGHPIVKENIESKIHINIFPVLLLYNLYLYKNDYITRE